MTTTGGFYRALGASQELAAALTAMDRVQEHYRLWIQEKCAEDIDALFNPKPWYVCDWFKGFTETESATP